MRSIWESVVRWLAEAEDDPDKPGDWLGLSQASKRAAKDRLKRARADVAARGGTQKSNQASRDQMARIMQDPDAARVLAQPPEEWDTELPGQGQFKGTPAIEPDELPKADQPAPGTAANIGGGRVAMKNAEPTSVALGAKARQFNPNVSGIKQRYGVTPDTFYDDRPVLIDPKTGKARDMRGRPKQATQQAITSLEVGIDKLKSLLKNPKTDKQRLWLQQRIKDKEAELEKLQAAPELTFDPFAAVHSAAQAANSAKKPVDKSKIHTVTAGPWKDAGGAVLPKGGEVHSTQGGKSFSLSAGDERKPSFVGQSFTPKGHTQADEEEWESNPALAARRMGGKGPARIGYGKQDVGQRGRMSLPANPGTSQGVVGNPYTGEFETPDQMKQTLQRPDIRAQVAAKLALRGADISNKRFGSERRPHASRASAEPFGQVVPKDAETQKKDAMAAAIASKPLGINVRRDDDEKPKHQYKPENPAATNQSGGSAGSSGEGPIDRSKMKQAIAQRIAAMAAKKSEKP